MARRAHSTSATAALDLAYKRIAESNSKFNALVRTYPQAEALARSQATGLLAGEPIVIKDNIVEKGRIASAASAMLLRYRSPYSASVVDAIEGAGGCIVGRANMDEFGMGSHTTHSVYGATLNPHDATRSAGGSSGGSAAAVALGFCTSALGSDTGGSVRLPASYCGVVGFKPTYGLLPRTGLIAYASSLDTIGVLARSCVAAARLADVCAAASAREAADSTCLHAAPELAAAAAAGAHDPARALAGCTVAVPQSCLVPELSRGMRAALARAAAALRALGARVVSVPLTQLPHSLAAYYVIASAEAASNLARYDGVRFGGDARAAAAAAGTAGETIAGDTSADFGAGVTAVRSRLLGGEVRRRVTLGNFVLSRGAHDAFYRQAQRVRARVCDDLNGVLCAGGATALLLPTALGTAPRLADVAGADGGLRAMLGDLMTVPASLAGLPALALPAGRCADDGLPLGLQLVGARLCDADVVRLGAALEASLDAGAAM